MAAPVAQVTFFVLALLVPSAFGLNGFLDLFTKERNLTLSGVGPMPEGNPYGVVLVPTTEGKLKRGNWLITNWNSGEGFFGQGHTIIQVSRNGTKSVFATIPTSKLPEKCGKSGDGIGLTLALGITAHGHVVVGNTPVPTIIQDGTPTTGTIAKPGCLIVLNPAGRIVATLGGHKSGINGPWGLALQHRRRNVYTVFVSNVLGLNASEDSQVNQGVITRHSLIFGPHGRVFFDEKFTVVGSDFPTIPAQITAGAVSPSGLAFNNGTGRLFVANTLDSSVDAINSAATCMSVTTTCTRDTLASGGILNLPIGLMKTPPPYNNIMGANGGTGDLWEVAPDTTNTQVTHRLVDNTIDAPGNFPGAGNLFSLAPSMDGNCVLFGNDNLNALQTLCKS